MQHISPWNHNLNKSQINLDLTQGLIFEPFNTRLYLNLFTYFRANSTSFMIRIMIFEQLEKSDTEKLSNLPCQRRQGIINFRQVRKKIIFTLFVF